MNAVFVIIVLTTHFGQSSEQLLEAKNLTLTYDNAINDISNDSSANDVNGLPNRRNLTIGKSFLGQTFSPNVTSKGGIILTSSILSSTNISQRYLQNDSLLSDTLTKTIIFEGSDTSTNDNSAKVNTTSDMLTSNNVTEVSDNIFNETSLTDSSSNDILSKSNETKILDILSNDSLSNDSLRESNSKDNETDISTNISLATDSALETQLSDNLFDDTSSNNIKTKSSDISSTDSSFDGNQTPFTHNTLDGKLLPEFFLNDTLANVKNQSLEPFETPEINSTSLLDDDPPENGFNNTIVRIF